MKPCSLVARLFYGSVAHFSGILVFVGIDVNGTSNVMKALVGSDTRVALTTTVVGVAVVLGVFTTLIIAVSLVALLRHRRYLTRFFESGVFLVDDYKFI